MKTLNKLGRIVVSGAKIITKTISVFLGIALAPIILPVVTLLNA